MLPGRARRLVVPSLGIVMAVAACGRGGSVGPPARAAVRVDWVERGGWGRNRESMEPQHAAHHSPLYEAQAPAARRLNRLAGIPLSRWDATVLLYESGAAVGRGSMGPPGDEAPDDAARRLMEDLRRYRSRGGLRPWAVTLRADRRVAWARVEAWLSRLTSEQPPVRTIVFGAVAAPDAGPESKYAWGGRVVASPARRSGSAGAAVAIRALSTDVDPAMEVSTPDATYAFEAGPPYAGEERVRRANAHWRALQTWMVARTEAGARTLPLEIDARATWAYVIQILSMAAAAGYTRLEFAGAPYALDVGPPYDDVAAGDGLERIATGRPWGLSPWWLVAGGAVAGALGVGACRASRRRIPSARAPR